MGSYAQKEEIKRGINQGPIKRGDSMAKDGTARGGQRFGAGRKSKALVDKINDGSLNTAVFYGAIFFYYLVNLIPGLINLFHIGLAHRNIRRCDCIACGWMLC